MKKALTLSALALASVPAVLTGELYRHVFCRGGSPLLTPLLDKKGHEEDYYRRRDEAAARLRACPRQVFTRPSARGEALRGFYYPGGGEGKRIAFLVHGYRSEHTETAGLYWDYYRSLGFDLFCCDHAAHGESEGRFIGFSVPESEECLAWLDFLIGHFGPALQIVLHGFSMGAATVLQMADRCPPQVKFLVEDSGFRDAQIQLRAQLGGAYPPLRLLHRLIAGVDLTRGDVRPHLERAELPILFVHGREDPSVPFENGPLLYEAYSGRKDCLFPEGVRHIESMYKTPAAYEAKLDAFLEQYIRNEKRM